MQSEIYTKTRQEDILLEQNLTTRETSDIMSVIEQVIETSVERKSRALLKIVRADCVKNNERQQCNVF